MYHCMVTESIKHKIITWVQCPQHCREPSQVVQNWFIYYRYYVCYGRIQVLLSGHNHYFLFISCLLINAGSVKYRTISPGKEELRSLFIRTVFSSSSNTVHRFEKAQLSVFSHSSVCEHFLVLHVNPLGNSNRVNWNLFALSVFWQEHIQLFVTWPLSTLYCC